MGNGQALLNARYEIGENDGAVKDADSTAPVEEGELVFKVQNREDRGSEFAEGHD